MPSVRFACVIIVLAGAQGLAAAPHAELAWPGICAEIERAGARPPDEVRRYRMRLNEQSAGRETFRFWRDDERIRVVVATELAGDIMMFPADFRHCREELWRDAEGGPQLLALDGATSYAVPFKPDWQVHIERGSAGELRYRGSSSVGSFEERWPENTGVVSPWSVSTTGYDHLLNVFERGAYPVESRLVGRATVNGREVVHYAFAGEWPRHLWYQDGEMIRFCAAEAFDTYIETVIEAYADRAEGALGLSRPCAELFE